MVDVDCAVGYTPCLTAADDSGYEIDEAEVIYWGRCPECVTATTSNQRSARSSRGEGPTCLRRQRERNPAIPAPTPKAHGPRTNQDWWPNQLDLPVLHQHSPRGQPDGRGLRLRRGVQDPRRRGAEARRHRRDDDVAGLVAGRLRPLRAALHPHDLARRGHVPHRTTAAAAAARARSASRRSTAGPTTPTSTRRAGCCGRSSRSTARRSPGPTCSCSPATSRSSRWGSRRSASASGGRTSGSPRRSSGAPRTPGSATSATAATASSPARSAPCRWA